MPVEHVCGSSREFAGVRWWHGRKGVATVLSEWKRAGFDVFQILRVCAKNDLIQALCPRGQPRCWGEALLVSDLRPPSRRGSWHWATSVGESASKEARSR